MSKVNHPEHYNQGGIECIDAMLSAFGKYTVSSFCICNAFKYLWRCREKNGYEDIEKAIWYLQKMLDIYKEDREDGEDEDFHKCVCRAKRDYDSKVRE